jgi:hypothetical protein
MAGVLKAMGGAQAVKPCPDQRLLPPLKSASSQPSGLWLHYPRGRGGGGIDESSLHDQAPEVQSKANPRSPLAEPQAQSMTTPGQRSAAEVSLPIIPSVGAARALTGCF